MLPFTRALTRCAGALLLGSLLTTGVSAQESPPPTPPEKPEQTFRIDSTHSTALFRIRHMGVGPFHGRFNDVRGTIRHAPGGGVPLAFEVSIPVASVDTGNQRLDDHLRSADFFDAEQHPELTFRSTAVEKAGESTYRVSGDLTIHGVTRPITVTLEHLGIHETQRGTRSGYESIFTVQRSEFDMKYGLDSGALGDEVRITVALEAIEGGPEEEEQSGSSERPRRRSPRPDLMGHDANGDGKLEKSELPERMARLFDRLDRDGDGFIDQSELDQGPGDRDRDREQDRPRDGDGERDG